MTEEKKRTRAYTVLYYCLATTMGFAALLCLTLVFIVYQNSYATGFLLIYSISPLFLSNYFRHSASYLITLPVPYIGSWLISIVYLSSYTMSASHVALFVSAIPLIVVTFVHLFSRNRNVIGHLSMASIGRSSIAAASGIFYMVALFTLGPTTLELNPLNKAIFYTSLLCAYIFSIMVFVNSAYRYRIVCKILGTDRLEKETSRVWKTIREKFSAQEMDVDLMNHYFSDAIRLFEEGNFEGAFLSSYKMISEKTVVNPKEHVSDKRIHEEHEPSSFSEIRTILMHSRREKTQINVKRIRETRKMLPKYCREILGTCFNLVYAVSKIEVAGKNLH
jgi:hypothetical protein